MPTTRSTVGTESTIDKVKDALHLNRNHTRTHTTDTNTHGTGTHTGTVDDCFLAGTGVTDTGYSRSTNTGPHSVSPCLEPFYLLKSPSINSFWEL
ncbi:hypothetical protein B7463_g8405, partial [Scytalidium lignicola]